MMLIAPRFQATSRAPRVIRALALVAGVALVGGCDMVEPDGCTLIGCVNGLVVQLSSRPITSYRIEVQEPGSSTPRVYQCPDPAQCGTSVVFNDYYPASATVTVVTGLGTVEQAVTPTYSVSRPNGEDCEPTCRQGLVAVTLPT